MSFAGLLLADGLFRRAASFFADFILTIHPVTLLKSVMYAALAVVNPAFRIGRPHSLVCEYRLPCTGIPTLARALYMREQPPCTQRGRLPCTYCVVQLRGGLGSCPWTSSRRTVSFAVIPVFIRYAIFIAAFVLRIYCELLSMKSVDMPPFWRNFRTADW